MAELPTYSRDDLPEYLRQTSMEELRELTIQSVINHMYADVSFMKSVAEDYVEQMDDQTILEWHTEV